MLWAVVPGVETKPIPAGVGTSAGRQGVGKGRGGQRRFGLGRLAPTRAGAAGYSCCDGTGGRGAGVVGAVT